MKRIALLSVVVLTSALLMAACSKDDSPVTPTAQAKASDYWWPTAANTTLTLEGTYKVTVGGTVTAQEVLMLTMTSLGGTATTSDGKTVHPFHAINRVASMIDTAEGYTYLSDQMILNYENLSATAEIDTVFRLPLAVGASWRSSSKDTTRNVIMSTSETVTTPVGTFSNCVRIRFTQGDPVSGETGFSDVWLAKGIGPVKTLTQYTGSFGGSTMVTEHSTTLKSKNF